MIQRPLTKETLKLQFLKTLWEHTRPGGKFANVARGVDSILHPNQSTLAELCELPNLDPHVRSTHSLTDQERRLGLQGVEELQRDGFIMNDPDQGNPTFKVLTEKGREYATRDPATTTLPTVDIDAVVSRGDLADLVLDDFKNGRYDVAIRSAFLRVEEAVRAKAGQGPGVTGHGLMAAAFSPNAAILRHPNAMTPDEERALFFLFAGANGWFRNPTAHRTVGYHNPHEAAQILGLANLLLDMVDKCN
jgi:uncharacterized protein (TIGR02391 family)